MHFLKIDHLKKRTAQNFYFNYIAKRWYIYLTGIFFVIITNVGEIIVPCTIGWIIDFLQTKQFPEQSLVFLSYFPKNLNSLLYLFIFALIIMFLSRVCWRLFLGQETHYANASLKESLWSRNRFLPLRRIFTDLNLGHLMNVSVSDVGIARFIFGWTIVGTTDLFFLGIMTLFCMFTIHVKLTIYCIILTPIFPFILNKLRKKEELYHSESQESLSSLNEKCSRSVETIKLQKLCGTEDFWAKNLFNSAKDYSQKKIKVNHTSILFTLISSCAPLLCFLALFFFGIQEYYKGSISLGDFIAFQSYVLLLQHPLVELGFVISEWQLSFTSLKRVTSILSEDSDDIYKAPSEIIKYDKNAQNIFKVNHLSFKYSEQQPLFEQLSFEINKAQKIGILGPIGCGKSTLLNILMGFEKNYQGHVQFKGHDLKLFNNQQLRDELVMVSQKPFLFASTIRDNILLNSAQKDDDFIWHCLECSGLVDDIKRFPEQLMTPLGEWGINLSGGQKQRLTLARALAQKPEILFLDDCLSAVDTVTEKKILSHLKVEFKDKTLVWVAHRASTLRLCDTLIDLGKVT